MWHPATDLQTKPDAPGLIGMRPTSPNNVSNERNIVCHRTTLPQQSSPKVMTCEHAAITVVISANFWRSVEYDRLVAMLLLKCLHCKFNRLI